MEKTYAEKKTSELFNKKIFGFLMILLGVGIYFAYVYAFFYFFVVLAIVFLIYGFVKIIEGENYKKWASGASGEKIVSLKLKGLPNSYFLIEDVCLTKYGNIDHIVIGPTGIFVVETKNHKGRIEFNGEDWTCHSGRFKNKIKDIGKQVIFSTFDLKKFLIDANLINPNFWIHSLIVFSNPETKFNINNLKIAEVFNPAGAVKFILEQEKVLDENKVEKIVNILKRFVRTN